MKFDALSETLILAERAKRNKEGLCFSRTAKEASAGAGAKTLKIERSEQVFRQYFCFAIFQFGMRRLRDL